MVRALVTGKNALDDRTVCTESSVFTEEKRRNAGKDLDTANWRAQQASYEEQKITDLERRLGK